jgi:FMN-dependent dehydrogenase
VQRFTEIYSRPSLTWETLAFLRQRTSVPIVLKGILHPDDAARAVDEGIDGVIVSNHGGRPCRRRLSRPPDSPDPPAAQRTRKSRNRAVVVQVERPEAWNTPTSCVPADAFAATVPVSTGCHVLPPSTE